MSFFIAGFAYYVFWVALIGFFITHGVITFRLGETQSSYRIMSFTGGGSIGKAFAAAGSVTAGDGSFGTTDLLRMDYESL